MWRWVLIVVAVGAALFALDQVALWAERRGWLYWRKKQSRFAGTGAVMAGVAEAFQESRQTTVQEAEFERTQRRQITSPDGPPEPT